MSGYFVSCVGVWGFVLFAWLFESTRCAPMGDLWVPWWLRWLLVAFAVLGVSLAHGQDFGDFYVGTLYTGGSVPQAHFPSPDAACEWVFNQTPPTYGVGNYARYRLGSPPGSSHITCYIALADGSSETAAAELYSAGTLSMPLVTSPVSQVTGDTMVQALESIRQGIRGVFLGIVGMCVCLGFIAGGQR